MSSDKAESADAVALLASQIDALAASGPSWMNFVRRFRSDVGDWAPKDPDDSADAGAEEESDDESAGSRLEPVRRAALFAFCYVVRFTNDQGRPQFGVKPFQEFGGDIWPPLPGDVEPEIAAYWPTLADQVQAPAPKARLYATAFLRGSADRTRHAAAAAESYLAASAQAERPAEKIDYLRAALRLSRAISDTQLAERALTGLLDFVDTELAKSPDGFGFAVQALEIAAVEQNASDRVDELARQLSTRIGFVPLADRALQILLNRASAPDKTAIWRERIELRRAEALAADHPAVQTLKLQDALQLAQASGQTDLRDQIAAELQACAKQDLGLISIRAASHQYEEAAADQVNAIIGGESWTAALFGLATFGPLTGRTAQNRKIIDERLAAHPLLQLMPMQLVGPDGLPIYTGTTPEDRYDMDLVKWETDLLKAWLPALAEALHAIPERHGTPTLEELYAFLQTWPGLTPGVNVVLTTALQRVWAGDSDGATYTALPQIEAAIRALVMSQNAGVFRAQQKQTPGQIIGLGALLPILGDTHQISEDWIRCYSTALVHPAGLNLRNLLLHGFGGRTGADLAALVLHLLLHLGTLEPPATGQ